MQKPAAYKVQGMQRDASPVNFKPENAFEIVNMRLITDEEGSAFALVNEKGTKLACTLDDNTTWIPIGQCATTDSLIVFAVEKTVNTLPLNAIFKIQEVEDKWISSPLFTGDLSFSVDSPIETLFNYETEDIKKVYWIDGINPLRCINLAQKSYSDNPTQFDSVLPFTDNQVAINIERLSGGSFKAGVIQYYITYFNKYRTESPIVWTSPLLYLANQERGAETDTNVNTAFKFNISGLDSINWEYVRLYSVFRSSIDTEPSANIVTEVKINNGTITAYDYGTSNTAIVASDLYFVGAKAVKAGTMTVKDQVLFLGNLKVDSKIEPESIDRSTYDLKTDTYKSRPFRISETEGTYYKYDNQLDNTESISTYKNGETYRFGYQLQDKWGNWSNPIFIEDKEIDFAPKMDYTDGEYLQLAQPSMDITALLGGFKDKGFIAARPLVVYPDVSERSILCQGVVCPTVYNLKDRKDNSPYAQASWFMRPNIPGNLYERGLQGSILNIYDHNVDYAGLYSTVNIIDGTDNKIESITDDTYIDIENLRLSLLADEVPHRDNFTYDDINLHTFKSDGKQLGEYITSRGAWTEFRHNYALKAKGHLYGLHYTETLMGTETSPGVEGSKDDLDRVAYNKKFYGLARGAEIDSTRGIAALPVNGCISGMPRLTYTRKYIDYYNTGSSAYYVDANIVTLNSPEIELVEDLYNINMGNYKFRIVGLIPLTANIGDMSLETKNPDLWNHDKSFSERGFHKLNIHTENIGHTGFRGLVSQNVYNAWKQQFNGSEAVTNGNTVAAHLLYPWHITGNIQTFKSSSNNRTLYSQIKRKVLSNLRFSAISYYLPKDKLWTSSTENNSQIITWTSTDNSIQKFILPGTLDIPDIVYKGNIDSLAMQEIAATGGTSYDLYYYAGETSNFGQGGDVGTLSYYEATYTTNSGDIQKGMSLAASIKYKSSPHYAIFLGGVSVDNKIAMEVLPTLGNQWEETTGENKWDITEYKNDGFIEDKDQQISRAYILQDVILTSSYSSNNGYSYTFTLKGDLSDTDEFIEETTTSPFSVTFTLSQEDFESLLSMDTDMVFNTNIHIKIGDFEQDTLEAIEVSLDNDAFKIEIDTQWYAFYFKGIVIEQILQTQTNSLNLVGASVDAVQESGLAIYGYNNILTAPIQQSIIIEEGENFNLPVSCYPSPSVSYPNHQDSPINYGWLWLGEIYKEDAPLFGGDNEYALQNNKWEIAGNTVPLLDGATLEWSIGDTYYQRFDTLKTYAYADTDENSVIDITSFMVETRLNIDGRYDRNRGQENNLNMSPQNFNLFNKVYTQRNNFFTYSITPEDAAKRLSFPTQITWSLVKTPGENIDQWLNTTMSAILDLDGRKGELTSLETMGNEIIAFQEKGIANIIYNPRTQISAMDGTPIYIANSTKVEGFRYISDNVGSQDKWSIVSTPNGLYFVDLYNKGIYKFNGQLEDVSNAKGFHSWCTQNLNKDSKILGYYDFKNKDVYFINSEWDYPCLAYSEFTESFSSFYSYRNAKLAYLQGQGIWLSDRGNIYLHQDGEYNKFLDLEHYSDYHVTIICNQDGNLSKIFNNIEFRADSWEGNTAVADKSIDYLAIETEYQKKTEEPLVFKKHGISNLKKKFNVWRANIPREQGTRNRFRDVWAKVTLGGRGNARKTRLNDIVVYYT